MLDLVRDCLEQMRRRDSDMLLMRYYEQLTYKEMAERLGMCNRGSAHWRVKCALGELERRIRRVIGNEPQA
jgi:DNA-directed RNA polymerase specialized sigma24 family protein